MDEDLRTGTAEHIAQAECLETERGLGAGGGEISEEIPALDRWGVGVCEMRD